MLSAGLGCGLVYWSLRGITPEQKQTIVAAFSRADYRWLFFIAFFGLLSNVFRAQRWRLLLKPMGYRTNFWNTFASINIMFLANLAFPRLGEVLRCSILARYDKVPIEKSIGTMVLERVVDLICILLLGGILLLLEYQRFYEFFNVLLSGSKTHQQINPETTYTKYLILIIAGCSAITVFALMLRKFGQKKMVSFIKEKFKGLGEGVISIRYLDKKWTFLLHTIAIWICYILMPYFAFRCLHETSSLNIICATANVFFGGFAMIATQGGIGAFQIITQKVLAIYSIPDIIGLSYGWISWSIQTIAVIIGGIFSIIFLILYNKRESNG